MIVIELVETERHQYFKVPLSLLDDLNIIPLISEYSYLGVGSEGLNEEHFGYLEGDQDFGYFDKAMNHYNRKYSVDTDTLTALFNDKYDYYRDWLEELINWDMDFICNHLGYYGDDPEEELLAVLFPDEEENLEED